MLQYYDYLTHCCYFFPSSLQYLLMVLKSTCYPNKTVHQTEPSAIALTESFKNILKTHQIKSFIYNVLNYCHFLNHFVLSNISLVLTIPSAIRNMFFSLTCYRRTYIRVYVKRKLFWHTVLAVFSSNSWTCGLLLYSNSSVNILPWNRICLQNLKISPVDIEINKNQNREQIRNTIWVYDNVKNLSHKK